MKTIILLLAALSFSACMTDSVTENTARKKNANGVSEIVTIGDDVFYSAYETNSDAGSLREFIPKGQTLENWRSLVGIRIFKNVASPKDYIRTMALQYQAKMPHMKFAVFEKKETGSWAIDYIMYPRNQSDGFVEWNYFEAIKNKEGRGIIVNQYVTRRPFSDSLEEVFSSWDIGKLRKEMMSILMPCKFEIKSVEQVDGD